MTEQKRFATEAEERVYSAAYDWADSFSDWYGCDSGKRERLTEAFHKAMLEASAPPTPADDVELCFICDVPLAEGDLVLDDINGGTAHRSCYGDCRDAFVDLETGEPIGPDEDPPKGYVYKVEPAPAVAVSGDASPLARSLAAMTAEWFAGPKPDHLDALADLIDRRIARYAPAPAVAVPEGAKSLGWIDQFETHLDEDGQASPSNVRELIKISRTIAADRDAWKNDALSMQRLLGRARKLTKQTFPGGGTITAEIDAVLAGKPLATTKAFGWARGIHQPSTTNGPAEYDVDFVYGDDEPSGEGWFPVYREPAPAVAVPEAWRPFNINRSVRVKLTDAGATELKRRHDELRQRFPALPEWSDPRDADGWFKEQLWVLMRKLGHMHGLGLSPERMPFAIEIEIPTLGDPA